MKCLVPERMSNDQNPNSHSLENNSLIIENFHTFAQNQKYEKTKFFTSCDNDIILL